MNCDKAKTLMAEHVFEELNSEERGKLRGHIAGCSGCRLLAEDMSIAVKLLTKSVELEEPKFTSEDRQKIINRAAVAAVRGDKKSYPKKWRNTDNTGRILGNLAKIAVVLFIVLVIGAISIPNLVASKMSSRKMAESKSAGSLKSTRRSLSTAKLEKSDYDYAAKAAEAKKASAKADGVKAQVEADYRAKVKAMEKASVRMKDWAGAEDAPKSAREELSFERNGRDVACEIQVENPVVTHEDVEIVGFVEIENNMNDSSAAPEVAISDIPCDGKGRVGAMSGKAPQKPVVADQVLVYNGEEWVVPDEKGAGDKTLNGDMNFASGKAPQKKLTRKSGAYNRDGADAFKKSEKRRPNVASQTAPNALPAPPAKTTSFYHSLSSDGESKDQFTRPSENSSVELRASEAKRTGRTKTAVAYGGGMKSQMEPMPDSGMKELGGDAMGATRGQEKKKRHPGPVLYMGVGDSDDFDKDFDEDVDGACVDVFDDEVDGIYLEDPEESVSKDKAKFKQQLSQRYQNAQAIIASANIQARQQELEGGDAFADDRWNKERALEKKPHFVTAGRGVVTQSVATQILASQMENTKNVVVPKPRPMPKIDYSRPPPPVNPFVLTKRDALSTFAIDTGSAAYTRARSFINSGAPVPPIVIRTEEFVNAFDYNYTQKAQGVFNVHTEAAASPFGAGYTLLKVGIKARVVGRQERRRANIVQVVDASGSMNSFDRIKLVEQSMKILQASLAPADLMSLVSFGNSVRVHFVNKPSKAIDIAKIIDSLECSGSTKLIDGLREGYNAIERNYIPGAINRVLLCTDGIAAVDEDTKQKIMSEVERYRKLGISLTVAGFGSGGYDDEFLETLSNGGDGNYFFIDTPAQARRVFSEELSSMLNIVAKDAKIQVEFDPKTVDSYRLIGYENRDIADKDFRNDAIDAGEVGSGKTATALYEIKLNGTPRPNETLAVVRVRYRNTDTERIEEIASEVTASSIKKYTVRDKPRFFLAASLAEFAEILRSSRYSKRNYNHLLRVLEPVKDALAHDKSIVELYSLVRKAARIKGKR